MGYIVEPWDYNFDFATTGLAAGSNTRVGQQAAYKWTAEGYNTTTPPGMPSEGFGEIAGIEVFPGIVNGKWEHADYIRLYIGGIAYDWQSFNELMAPGLAARQPDPLGAVGLRHGIMATNFGTPMLMGGSPLECCPKVPPNKAVEVEIAAAPADEGGASGGLTKPWTVRVWVAKCLGIKNLVDTLKFQSLYTNQGYFNGQDIDVSFDLGDLETAEIMPLRTKIGGNPIRKVIAGFNPVNDWGKLPGGMEQLNPKMTRYWIYAKQMEDTSVNEQYQFTMNGQYVHDKWGELTWNYDRKDALKITHLGFKQPAVGTIKNLIIERSNRSIKQVYDVQPAKNPFGMPRYRDATSISHFGPAKLAKPITFWNENASIEMKDNGTAVDGYSSNNDDSTMIIIGGIKYELGEVI